MKRKIFLSFFVLAVCIALGSAVKAKAELLNVVGWLWGGSESSPDGIRNDNETGVGSISVKNIDKDGNLIDPGATTNYGLIYDNKAKTFSGYAWSPNLGYIDFSPQNNCKTSVPDAEQYQALSCTPPVDSGCSAGVKMDEPNKRLTGCARVVEIAKESTFNNSGGWEGWINMDGVSVIDNIDKSKTLYGYGWNAETSGSGNIYAYGLGHINFTNVTILPPNILKICKNSCDSGQIVADSNNNISEETAGNLNLTIRKTLIPDKADLVACFGKSLECDEASNNVTYLSTSWNRVLSSSPAISIGNINNQIYEITSSIKPEDADSVKITVNHHPSSESYEAIFKVNVGCYDDDSCAENTCIGEECKDFCGIKHKGVKDCAWREVAP